MGSHNRLMIIFYSLFLLLFVNRGISVELENFSICNESEEALDLCVSMDEIFDRKLLFLIDYYIQELFKHPDEDTGLTYIFE